MQSTIGLISANYISEELDKVITERPLAAMPFGARYRLIDFPLSNMKNSGISVVGLIMPYNNRSLIDHVGTGKAWNFGRKTHSLFMLPGSVYGKRNNTSKFLLRDVIFNFRFIDYDKSDHVLMCASNCVYNMDFRPMIEHHRESGADTTRLYGKIDGEDAFLDCFIINRSFLIDMTSWFHNLDFLGINEIIDQHIADAKVERYEFSGYAAMINTMEQYLRTNLKLLDDDIRSELFDPERQILTNVQDRAPTFYAPSAKIKNSLIAAGCIIEGEVENSVIFRSSNVGKGAKIKNSVLMQHCSVGCDAVLNNFVCDKRVLIREGAHVEGSPDTPYFAMKGQIV